MSIKIEMFIELPYIIKLAEEKDYKFSLDFNDFDMFNLDIIYNDENEEIYNESYPAKSSCNLRIEAIYKNIDYSIYEKTSLYSIPDNGEYQVSLPKKQEEEIFNIINKKMEIILSYLRKKTNMFWIERILIERIGFYNDNKIDFNFYSPNTKLIKSVKLVKYYSNDYRLNYSNIIDVNDNIFNDFDSNKKYIEKYELYLNKAEKCLYEREYDDFIIYSSIAVESFIRRYVSEIEPDKDIVYKRISSSNYDYLDQYYNVILKYLRGTSLKEKDKTTYMYLKRMYNLRNAIMHKGFIDQTALQKAGLSHLEKLNDKECQSILDGIKKAFVIVLSL